MATPAFEKLRLRNPYTGSIEENFCTLCSSTSKDIVDSLAYNGTYFPSVSRVITSHAAERTVKTGPGPKDFKVKPEVYTTIVEFSDGTRSIVKCSAIDKPDTELAIVNAIVKRAFGTVGPKGVVNGNGCGLWLKNLASNAWNQEKENARIKEEKAKARQDHIDRQALEHKDAHDRKIKKLATEISNTLEALKSLGLDISTLSPACKSVINECSKPYPKNNKDTQSCTCTKMPSDTSEYVRPDKPFSQFTQAEKRAYWKAQKNGALKK